MAAPAAHRRQTAVICKPEKSVTASEKSLHLAIKLTTLLC